MVVAAAAVAVLIVARLEPRLNFSTAALRKSSVPPWPVRNATTSSGNSIAPVLGLYDCYDFLCLLVMIITDTVLNMTNTVARPVVIMLTMRTMLLM